MKPVIAHSSHGDFGVTVRDSSTGVRLRFTPIDGPSGETVAFGVRYRLTVDLFCAPDGSSFLRTPASSAEVRRRLTNDKWVTLHNLAAANGYPGAWVDRELLLPLVIWAEDHAAEVMTLITSTLGREARIARGRAVSYRDLVAKTDPADRVRMARNRSILADAEAAAARIETAMAYANSHRADPVPT